MKVQYSVYKKETGSAGGKAKNDIYDIAQEMGFEPSYNPSGKRFIRVIQQLLSMKKTCKADVLLVQYPAIDKRIMEVLVKHMNPEGIRIAIIHDLPSIQGMDNGNKLLEIEQLSHFNYLIVHNAKMEAYLRKQGYVGNIVQLKLFDYLHDINRPITESKFNRTISIAGNLKKGKYILDLGKIDSCDFDLFGIKGDMDFSNIQNAHYRGMLSSDEIEYKLSGDYGLIWDGDSLDSCSGVYGQYLKYNNPHKLSLCMAAGKPVIVWSKAAVADFVREENIGICVDSLLDLNNIDLKKDYDTYKSNVMKIKERVAEGYYFKRAINSIFNTIK